MRVGPAFLQTFASQVIQSAASIATGILIARGLGPAGQGQYALFVAAVALVSTVAAGGQFEGHVLVSSGEQSRGRILLLRSVGQTMVAFGVLAASEVLWRRWLGVGGQRGLSALLASVLTFELLALLFRGINLGQHHITAYNVAALVQRVVYLASVAVLVLFQGLNVSQVVGAWLAAVCANVILSGFWIWWRSEPVKVSWAAIRNGWGRSLTRGFRALLTISLTLVLTRADIYMLGPILGLGAVGQISVASALAEYLWYVPSILSNVLFAAVAANRGPDTVAKVCRAFRAAIATLGPMALTLLVVGRRLVPLIYGRSYDDAGIVFVLLVPGMLAIALHLIVDSYFAGSGFPPVTYLAAAGAVLFKACLNLVAVPRFGVQGAAMATSVVYACLLSVKVVAFRRATGVPLRSLFHVSWSDVTYNVRVVQRWVQSLSRVPAKAES